MEDESSPSLSAKPPPLNSDQLNYLIWRYLQESGYGEAAVKLQRDWNVNAEGLPFAKHVKGQALVSLVQKGLRYHHLSLTIDETGRPSKQLNPAMFFFGPESERQNPEVREPIPRPTSSHYAPSPDGATVVPRKHGRELGQNGATDTVSQPVPKRSRKTTNLPGQERNGTIVRKTSAPAQGGLAVPMDVDSLNGHAPSMLDAKSPSATDIGAEENDAVVNGIRSDERMDVDTETDLHQDLTTEPIPVMVQPETIHVGIQVTPAKIANLSPSTAIFDLPAIKQITQASWRPQDNNILTASGDDFCGIWRTAGQNGTLYKPQFQDLVTEGEQCSVSAVAWEPSGAMLAIATYADQSGRLHLYDGQELGLLETLPASQRAITCLQWQKSGLRLVGLAPYDDQNVSAVSASSILLWDLSGAQGGAGPLSITVPERLLDVDCAFFDGTGVACAAGEQAVYYCRAFSELEVGQKFVSSVDPSDQWAFVKCSWRGTADPFVVAASVENARVWLPVNGIVKRDAHDAEITGLQIRPHPVAGPNALSTSEFATSSVDATIKVWRYDERNNTLTSIWKLSLGYSLPIMTLSYSPDGFCLVGASYGNIRIWNAEHGHQPMASWQGNEAEWKGNALMDDDLKSTAGLSSMNGDGPRVSADHSLTWDVDSKKLAFALGSQVALINFQR